MTDNPSVDDVGMSVHGLFIGSRNGDAWSTEDRDAVFTETSRLFNSFTIMDAMGCYIGRPVRPDDPWGSNDVQRCAALAHVLGRLIKQKEVGLETMGRFHTSEFKRMTRSWLAFELQICAGAM